MPTPTKLYSGWSGVSFTPDGGVAIPITQVSSVGFDPGGELTEYMGDTDRFPTGLFNLSNKPTATVTTANIGTLMSLPFGTVGTLAATLNDVVNKATTAGGAIEFVLENAVLKSAPASAKHGSIAEGTATFGAYSTDGVTNPLSTSLA